jgi:hypothetical protein
MFPLTLEELRERLKSLDEVSLLELLNINSEDLVKAFSDYIEDNFESLINEVHDKIYIIISHEPIHNIQFTNTYKITNGELFLL